MMMSNELTVKDAIEIISTNPVAYPDPDAQSVWDEAIRLAILALRKDVPFKPKIERWMPTSCTCGYNLSIHYGDGYFGIEKYLDRCPCCGQRLVWE